MRRSRRLAAVTPPPWLESAVTRSTVLRVWVGLLFLGVAGWLVIGVRGGITVDWTEGTIAPQAIYAPMDFSFAHQAQTVTVQRDELIVARGQRVTASHVAALRALADQAHQPLRTADAWGLGLLTVLISVAGFLVFRLADPRMGSHTRALGLLGLLILVTLGAAHAVLRAAWPIWGLPMAATSMALTLLLNPTAAIVATVVTGLLVGLMAGQQLAVALGLIFGGVAGIVAVRGARKREHLLAAGAWSGAVQALAILAVLVAEHTAWREALWIAALGGACSGAIAFVLTIALLPVLEKLFGFMTDITLLELSDLNHPLLKELSLKAPGTYHHSLIVATLAEAGCEAIGANGLLARVGCYFHDIGKMPKADYFVENQPVGHSRHDALSPSMSSLIILNHVKEGIELAQAHHLNPAIIDFIPGHHGTGLIYYFYRRAIEQVEDERLLKEESFRYPGPRPRTRETAVAMLADSSEAACRALPDHSAAKLTGVVRRMINNKFIDGQLNDCELTLRDLERIAEAFVRVLTGMYHSRVPYPLPPGEDIEDEELHAGADPQSAAGAGPRRPRPTGG